MSLPSSQSVPPAPSGGGIIRRMVSGTAGYAVAVFLGRAASFLLFPVYTRFLSPADYGVLELLELTLYAYGVLLGMRIGEALIYRWSNARGEEERSVIVATAFWGAALLGVVSVAAGWLLSPWFSMLVFGVRDYERAFVLMFSAFAAGLPLEVGLALARAGDRPRDYLALSALRLVITASLNIWFLTVLHWRYEALLCGNLIGSLAVSLASLGYIGLRGHRWAAFRAGELRRLLAYGAPLGFSGLGMLIIHYGDRFFLRHYASLADIGVYSLAYKIGMLVTYLQTPFDIYWRAQMFQIVRHAEGERIYVRVCTYLGLVLMAFTVFLLGFSVPILNILAGPAFRSAAQFIPLIAFAYVVRTVGAHFRNAMLLEGETRQDALVVWSGSLAGLAAYALLIPKYRVWGAVLATLIAFTVMFFLGLWLAQRVRQFPIEYRRLALLVAAAAPAALGAWLYQPAAPAAQWAFGFLLLLSFPLLLYMLGFFEKDELALASRWLARRTGARPSPEATGGR
ncbi:MAG: oligosaccharide flippase family protein [Bryobacteraceae bacterium]|nr:oligosaccharide flippase family protein [Bryobacteraceae bacterium]MCX7602929.1 oligosaccharide flippase family protein [Bryobacteraceae bacterium]